MKTLADPAVKSEIVQRLRHLAADAPRQWGKMSVPEMVCHLCDAHLLAMGEITASDRSTWALRNVGRIVALRVPMPWPKGLQTVRELDQSNRERAAPEILDAGRARLIQLIDRFTAAPPRDFHFARHPMFAEMSEWEWMRWGYLHADHHLRQFGS